VERVVRATGSSAPIRYFTDMSAATTPTVTDPGMPLPDAYDPTGVEEKWQARWRSRETNATDLATGSDKFYALMMFPYPSAEGLHVGNLFAFTGNDIYARFHRMQGRTVFEPLGYDAFGIHSENFALKVGAHPSELIPRNIANFRRQLERAGLMVDWRYAVDTTDPGYYRWTQWVFLELYKRGLAYRKKAAVNWCPFDKTVLANEQVINGECERCGSKVEQRFLEQWFFAISQFAPRLLANLDRLDWSETTKTAQRNWIGKSEGAEIRFTAGDSVTDNEHETAVTVFTTRPDTVFGATYLVLAPEHPLANTLTTDGQRAAVERYREQTADQDLVSRRIGTREKTGVFTGSYATNPATGGQIPIWVADYVLMDYGTGAIMAVPGHDERDFAFAETFGLPVVQVVAPDGEASPGDRPLAAAYTGTGQLIRSGAFDGLTIDEGKRRIVDWLAEHGSATAVENYRIHDWCISRQRYWGPPIPIVYCDHCGPVPVPAADLPVLLPFIADFKPDDSGVSPLARHEEWYRVPCPACGAPARRETDVSDTFLDSAWYFLRYPSANREDVAFDATLTQRWLPVDSYIGGNEHAVLHLLYARFVTMVLHDAGLLDFEEPFTRFRAHGLIVRDGAKMSKSKGNIINPDQYIAEWGADAFRTYLMFLGPYEQGGDFRDASISGPRRFLDRLWSAVLASKTEGEPDPGVRRELHRTIRKVSEDVPRLSYNTAIAALMAYMNVLRAAERRPHRAEVEPLVQLVAPFAPHIAEELWERLGHEGSVFDAAWPSFDAALAAEQTVTVAIQVNGKLRGTVVVAPDALEDEVYASALADPAVARHITTPPRKRIYVPGRLMNLVVSG
jgi:leucyl-tRNA synthetase